MVRLRYGDRLTFYWCCLKGCENLGSFPGLNVNTWVQSLLGMWHQAFVLVFSHVVWSDWWELGTSLEYGLFPSAALDSISCIFVINVDCKLIMVDLFLLVTTLKCCGILFPLLSNSAQKTVEMLVYKLKSNSHFYVLKIYQETKICLLLVLFFIGSYVTTKVVVLRPNFYAFLIWLFKILHAFAHWNTLTWHWDYQ